MRGTVGRYMMIQPGQALGGRLPGKPMHATLKLIVEERYDTNIITTGKKKRM